MIGELATTHPAGGFAAIDWDFGQYFCSRVPTSDRHPKYQLNPTPAQLEPFEGPLATPVPAQPEPVEGLLAAPASLPLPVPRKLGNPLPIPRHQRFLLRPAPALDLQLGS